MKISGSLPLAAAVLFSVTGCSRYFIKARPSVLPQYIHSIAIRPFTNHTQQYGLEDKLTLAVQSAFSSDGRYQITTENQGDGVVVGDITKYLLEPLSYDVNHVPTQYKLSIYVDLAFEDKVMGKELWKEPNMLGELRYFVATSGLVGALSETDAQASIWDQLSRDIVTRTIEGFGAVKGPSDTNSNADLQKAILNNNPPATPNPEPPAPSPTKLPY